MRSVLCVLLATLLSASSCAFMVKENRVLTNSLDEVVEPEAMLTKILLSPVFVPVGAVTLALDAAIIHPLSEIPNAWSDTSEAIWEEPQGSPLWQTFLVIPKFVMTPIFFSFDWIFRSLFDV